MQLQQLHLEIRKLRRELQLSFETREDLQDELNQMTQMYLTCKQERDQFKAHCERVRKDMEAIDRIVKENVERAVRAKDKQIADMMNKFKEQQERVAEAEAVKECFSNSIKSLESQLEEARAQLAKTESENLNLRDQMASGGVFNPMNEGEEFEPFELDDNLDNLKKMQIPDANFLRKINEADNHYIRISIDKTGGAIRASGVNPLPALNSGATTNAY